MSPPGMYATTDEEADAQYALHLQEAMRASLLNHPAPGGPDMSLFTQGAGSSSSAAPPLPHAPQPEISISEQPGGRLRALSEPIEAFRNRSRVPGKKLPHEMQKQIAENSDGSRHSEDNPELPASRAKIAAHFGVSDMTVMRYEKLPPPLPPLSPPIDELRYRLPGAHLKPLAYEQLARNAQGRSLDGLPATTQQTADYYRVSAPIIRFLRYQK